MFRQALEGVLGLRLVGGQVVMPDDPTPSGGLSLVRINRDVTESPMQDRMKPRPIDTHGVAEPAMHRKEPWASTERG
jgi:hypothetical protein